MTKSEVFSFMNDNPFFHLATEENGQPHTRIIRLYKADESGIIFNVGKHKDVFRELTTNPKVELCFYNAKESRQVRVGGEVEIIEDMELKMSIVDNHTYLKPWIEKEGYDALTVCLVRNGVAYVWRHDNEPKIEVRL